MIQLNSSPTRTKRKGISIIEVLTSIVVAMIGVFGVMVMIPFAISQAQQGLDQEKASSLALNAVAEFEIRNHTNTSRWAQFDGTSLAGFPARSYLIDPLGVAERNNAGVGGNGSFPFLPAVFAFGGTYENVDTGVTSMEMSDQNISLDRITLLNQPAFPTAPAPMSQRHASHLYAWPSELVFNEPVDADIFGSGYTDTEIAPPSQVLDVLTSGVASNRQAIREMSYVVVAVPSDISPSGPYQDTGLSDRVVSWRNYFVVYKDKPLAYELAGTEPAYDRVFEVTPPVEQAGIDPGNAAPNPVQLSYRVSPSGGDLVMTEVTPLPSSQRDEVRRGDWMMLTNVFFNHNRDRFVQQVNFYKVVDADFNGTQWNISLQGPDFDFLHPIDDIPGLIDFDAPVAGESGCRVLVDSGNSEPFTIRPSRTFAVHLPDVFAVFERTYR